MCSVCQDSKAIGTSILSHMKSSEQNIWITHLSQESGLSVHSGILNAQWMQTEQMHEQFKISCREEKPSFLSARTSKKLLDQSREINAKDIWY